MRYGALLAGVILVWSGRAAAADIPADPSDYKAKVGTLTPGDTLVLAPGRYRTLTLSGLNGSDAKPIVIAGPSSGAPAVFVADPGPCCNTVEIKDSSYVVLRNVTIDGNHVDGAFGVSAKSGVVHHITIEGCNFINHDGSQQHDGISTKVATWGWVIRRNRISGVGTGLYLGNSNGAAPFIGGLIEGNLILDSIGYGMQIKYQKPRASVPGMPTAPSTTIIRDNVFIKTDRPSPDGDRPNLLVGGFPDSGPGSQDLYEIYGNFFFHNPNESLFQGSGRVSLHDNVFVDVKGTAIRLQNHDLPLKLAHVYNNTIYAAGTGIGFGSKASEGDLVTGNLIFATTAISGNVTNQSDNLTDTVANAPSYVASPSLALGAMDFFPLAGKCEGSPLALASVSSETDYDRDFNGASKGGFTFRGAYAGSGTNPGWQLAGGFKDDATGPGTGGSAGSGGASAGSGGASAGSGGANAGSGGATAASADDGGCGCRVAPARTSATAALAALLGGLLLGARRRVRSGRGVPRRTDLPS